MTAAQPDRLGRIEALLERSIQQSDKRQTRMESAITELSQTQLRMIQESADYRRDMLEMRADIREMQQEVKGLQTENHRILDRLFGQQSN
jgi:predicted  nucleic acid-binding Zn-ribbon protein